MRSYLEADQRLSELYADPDAWARKAILNVAGSGKFSSDRTIAEYAAGIWNAEPCPVMPDIRAEGTSRASISDGFRIACSVQLAAHQWPCNERMRNGDLPPCGQAGPERVAG